MSFSTFDELYGALETGFEFLILVKENNKSLLETKKNSKYNLKTCQHMYNKGQYTKFIKFKRRRSLL